MIYGHFEVSSKQDRERVYQRRPTYVHLLHNSLQPSPTVDWYGVARVTINVLPDISLLDFYATNAWIEAWHTLMHVCQNGEIWMSSQRVA